MSRPSCPAPPPPISEPMPVTPKENMVSTIVKAAAVQISPVLYSRQGTVEKVVKKIRELGKQGVQFATFPETIIPYYPYFSFVQSAFDMRTGKEHGTAESLGVRWWGGYDRPSV